MILSFLFSMTKMDGQYQTTLGFSNPTNEFSPGGVILPTGEFLILGSNDHHPNSIYSLPDGDIQLDWLDNSGAFIRQSRMFGVLDVDTAAWIENAKDCNGFDALVIASSSSKLMMLTMVDLLGYYSWSISFGDLTSNNIFTSACVKMDANGLFILVGTQHDITTGRNSIVTAQVDCQGNINWTNVYLLNNYSATVTSVTSFASITGGQGSYFITGKVSPISGGDEQVFICKISTLQGNFNSLKLYNLSNTSHEVGTCIQGITGSGLNDGIWVSGYTDDLNGFKTGLMFRTDLNGVPLWANTYDVTGGNEVINHFQFATNNKLVLTGKGNELATPSGDCILMRLDANTGTSMDFTHLFFGIGASSVGNRVEVSTTDEYFVAGQSFDISQSTTDIFALRTDMQGLTDTTCYFDLITLVKPQMLMLTEYGPASITLDQVRDTSFNFIDTTGFSGQQVFCSFPPANCDFTWTPKNCFEVDFSGTIQISGFPPGIYQFTWDFDCGGPLPPVVVFETVTSTTITSLTSTISHLFPCGGGPFNVCLTIDEPSGQQCTVMHNISVPNTCCGQIISQDVQCTPNANVYAYTIVISDPPYPGFTCIPNLTNTTPGATLISSNYQFTGFGTTIFTGFLQVPSTTPLFLNFNVVFNCLCPSGAPVVCNFNISIPTICCKEIHIDDHTVCESAPSYNVPIIESVWPPLNNISQVTWYVMPKPPGGCPTVPWGGTPYQDGPSTTLTPLHLYPNTLTTDLCVYAVVHLNDGPCKTITSNIACISRCAETTCTLNDYDYCYTGTPVIPGLLSAIFSSPVNACPLPLLDWFDTNGLPVQTGGSSYQPTTGLTMVDPINNCYEDFYYTLQITDACGIHTCQSRVRLYSDVASPGSLVMDPYESPFLCPNGDATLVFLPGCAGDPKTWSWFSRPCSGGTPTPILDAGDMNPKYNTNQLTQSMIYSVQTQNGVCPADMVDLLVEVKESLSIISFSGISDPCVEQFVTLTLDFQPCNIAGCNTGCNCTYTIDWFKDGFLIGSSANIPPPQATFTYTIQPLAGNYYAIITADCCPEDSQISSIISFDPACEPVVLGPCFICDNQPVQLSVEMVIPPTTPCPTMSICTFNWYYLDPVTGWTNIGSGTAISISNSGQYYVESNCNGCIKTKYFSMLACQSLPCGLVSIEELLSQETSPVHVYPNPSNGDITVEWYYEATKDSKLFITDPIGNHLRSIDIPVANKSLLVSIADLPSGIYFVKIFSRSQLYTVARLVKE